MNCIGIDTDRKISVLFHVFGFAQCKIPHYNTYTNPSTVSLKKFMEEVQGDYININVIRVGIENFDDLEKKKIDYAIYRARIIYGAIELGLGRIEHYDIPLAEVNKRNDIGSVSEATALTREWTVDNDAIDVFVVENISSKYFVGISSIGGPCNKDAPGKSGVIGGEVSRYPEDFARTFAHEIGHYLGLPHNHLVRPDCPETREGCNNLMAQSRCATNCGDGAMKAVLLTSKQRDKIKKHCFVHKGCK